MRASFRDRAAAPAPRLGSRASPGIRAATNGALRAQESGLDITRQRRKRREHTTHTSSMGLFPSNRNCLLSSGQGLTLIHFSAQLEPCLTQQNTLQSTHPEHPHSTGYTTHARTPYPIKSAQVELKSGRV